MTDFKDKIISELDVLRIISVNEEAGAFKSRNYAAAIRIVTALPHVHTIEDLPPKGVGKDVRIKIQTIIEKGGLDIPTATRAAATALDAFQNIYGVGPKKAQLLLNDGYKTIASLRSAVANDPKLLNKNQQIGLRYYEQLLMRIPRAEMDQHADLLMSRKPASLEGVIVGSYRRGKPDSGDIDMLIRTSGTADVGVALTDFVTALQVGGYITEILAKGDHKCLAICQLRADLPARRLDLLVTPPAEFPFAVFYFTGCDTFNVAVRSHALTRGFTLNEHGITQVSSGLSVTGVKTEKDIFALLKLHWVEPIDRTGPAAVVQL
jgi:DNA polymerase/3'-5' exonuclease PolX